MPTPGPFRIPSVSELLESPTLKSLVDRVSHQRIVSQVRGVLDEVRQELQTSASERSFPQVGDLAERIARRVLLGESRGAGVLINATGVLLPSGMSGPPLADEAVGAMAAAAREYVAVEQESSSGRAAVRDSAVEGLLVELTGAEAALVVHDHAAAATLALAALAAGREVVVSRGHLGELDGYRATDAASIAGASLREVGATNQTRLEDYRDALDERAAAVLVAPGANFQVVGASGGPELAEIVRLARERATPVVFDAPRAGLVDLSAHGLVDAPSVRDAVASGADLVLFSGRRIGGPECGIAVGRRQAIEKMRAHRLLRLARVDAPRLAALGATLRLYRDSAAAMRSIPLLALVSTSAANLKQRALRMAEQMAAAKGIARADAIEGRVYLSGDPIPGEALPSWSVALTPAERSAERLAAQLRQGAPAVAGRVEGDRILLDLRSIPPRHDLSLVEAVEGRGKEPPEAAEARESASDTKP